MEENTSALWQAIYEAYEAHAPEEARRLLGTESPLLNCAEIPHCNDEDYIRWLLHHQLILVSQNQNLADNWPNLQERQLQCNALPEPGRPDCILKGEWKDAP